MPNWAEGNIRFRGNRENIIHFLIENLKGVYELKDEEIQLRPIYIEENCGGEELVLAKDPDTSDAVYFNQSRRQFIDFDFEREICAEFSSTKGFSRDDQVLFLPGFRGAWEVDSEYFNKKAIEYRIDIRIFVWELGMQWSSVKTFFRNGETEEEKRTYADWMWDCSMPTYGG